LKRTRPNEARESGAERGLVAVSNRDEHVQRLRPSANGSRAPERVPARVLVLDFNGGRRLRLGKAGGIDVLPGEASQARENGRSRAPFHWLGGVRGFERRSVKAAEKAPALGPRSAKARRGAARPEAGDVPSSTEPLEAG
jgi:hypothetical protein